MKKRIISGVVMGAIVAFVLALGLGVQNKIITVFVAGVAAIGVTEFVCNAAKIQNKIFKYLTAAYTAVMTYVFCNSNVFIYKLLYSDSIDGKGLRTTLIIAAVASIVYEIATAILILVYEKELSVGKIAALCGMPIVYAFAFSTLASIIVCDESELGLYYLLLTLNFACVCDTGAYFVGVKFGKTKLCPEISPNKTVEGALGGIAASIIASLVITLSFGYFTDILPVLVLTIPLCAAGMAGDLFASVIKRKAGIKDYSNLIPGHGGILDRVDSILFISPLVFCAAISGVI